VNEGETAVHALNSAIVGSTLSLGHTKVRRRRIFPKSRRVRSRVAIALRLAARSLHHAKDYMGEFFRRICRKLGKSQAITATAHKHARIVYHALSTREAYDESVFHQCEEEALKRAEMRLRRQAAHLGFRIIPADAD
jgi:hypothetical protein